MEFVFIGSASGKKYGDVLAKFNIRKLNSEDKLIYGECVITFESIDELMRFEEVVGDIVISDSPKLDGSGYYKAITIYDAPIY